MPEVRDGATKTVQEKASGSTAAQGREPGPGVAEAAVIGGGSDTAGVLQPSEFEWSLALAEYQGEHRRPGLWARLFAEAGGNEGAAQAAYLKIRAAEIAAGDKRSRIRRTLESTRLGDPGTPSIPVHK